VRPRPYHVARAGDSRICRRTAGFSSVFFGRLFILPGGDINEPVDVGVDRVFGRETKRVGSFPASASTLSGGELPGSLTSDYAALEGTGEAQKKPLPNRTFSSLQSSTVKSVPFRFFHKAFEPLVSPNVMAGPGGWNSSGRFDINDRRWAALVRLAVSSIGRAHL